MLFEFTWILSIQIGVQTYGISSVKRSWGNRWVPNQILFSFLTICVACFFVSFCFSDVIFSPQITSRHSWHLSVASCFSLIIPLIQPIQCNAILPHPVLSHSFPFHVLSGHSLVWDSSAYKDLNKDCFPLEGQIAQHLALACDFNPPTGDRPFIAVAE